MFLLFAVSLFILINYFYILYRNTVSLNNVHFLFSEKSSESQDLPVEKENIKLISEHEVIEIIIVCLNAKLRGHLKALVTKVLSETLRLAILMIMGKVISLEINFLRRKIGYRGSKTEFIFCKRATSRWFFSITLY